MEVSLRPTPDMVERNFLKHGKGGTTNKGHSTAHVNYGTFFTPHSGLCTNISQPPFQTEDSPKVPQLVSGRVEVQTQGLGPRTQPATSVIYKKATVSGFFKGLDNSPNKTHSPPVTAHEKNCLPGYHGGKQRSLKGDALTQFPFMPMPMTSAGLGKPGLTTGWKLEA